MKINLEQLRASNLRLFRLVKPYTSFSGEIEGELPVDIREQLEDYLKKRKPAEPQIDPDKLWADQMAAVAKDSARVRDRQAALTRLDSYEGLQPTAENLQTIQNWLDENVDGVWTPEFVDAAVANCGPRGSKLLVWTKPAAPPEKQAQPWQPGDELPPNASEAQLRASSIEEIKAWTRRQNG